MVGVYSILTSTISVRSSLLNKNSEARIKAVLDRIVSEDIESMTSKQISMRSDIDGNAIIGFETWHSLFFSCDLPVKVSWYVDNGYLVREEKEDNLNFDIKTKLIGNVKQFHVYGYNGTEFSHTLITPKLMKITLEIDNKTFKLYEGVLNE